MIYYQPLWWKGFCLRLHLKQLFLCWVPRFLQLCICPWWQHSSRKQQWLIQVRKAFLFNRCSNSILMTLQCVWRCMACTFQIPAANSALLSEVVCFNHRFSNLPRITWLRLMIVSISKSGIDETFVCHLQQWDKVDFTPSN